MSLTTLPYARRRELALLITTLLAVIFALAPWQRVLPAEIHKPSDPPPIQLELTPPEPEPTPPPRKAEPVPPPVSPVTPRLIRSPVVTHDTAPTPNTPSPATPPSPEQPSPPSQAHLTEAAPVPVAPPVPPPSNTNAERNYETALKAFIESRKTYPSGRQVALERPEGTAHVCLHLARNGHLQDTILKESTGSILLDQAARRLLASLSYPPFEEGAFRGQDEHDFCVHLKYEVPRS